MGESQQSPNKLVSAAKQSQVSVRVGLVSHEHAVLSAVQIDDVGSVQRSFTKYASNDRTTVLVLIAFGRAYAPRCGVFSQRFDLSFWLLNVLIASGVQTTKKPPIPSGRRLSLPTGDLLFSEISLAAHRLKTLVPNQGTLRLRRLPDLLSEVVPDVR